MDNLSAPERSRSAMQKVERGGDCERDVGGMDMEGGFRYPNFETERG